MIPYLEVKLTGRKLGGSSSGGQARGVSREFCS